MEINNNTPLNFKAHRIATVQRKFNPIVEKNLKEIPSFEKIEVFRLDGTEDIPFAKKIIKGMEANKRKLNEAQEKLLENLRDFIKNPFGNRSYVSIKNDEHISGYSVVSDPCEVYIGISKSKHKAKILEINKMTDEDFLSLETLRYSVLADKELGKDKTGLDDWSNFLNIGNNNLFGTRYNSQYQRLRNIIKNRNPEYDFSVTAQKEKFDLEEILDIKNVEV